MKIAIIGARGCVGSALIEKLVTTTDHEIIASFRREEELGIRHERVQWKRINLHDDLGTTECIMGADVVVYLIHSLVNSDFRTMDHAFAERMGRCAQREGVQKIVYLGGIIPQHERLSPHLRSRKETGEQLAKYGVSVAEMRASIILGVCSASYQMVYWLAKRLPIIVMPQWGATKCSPVALEDAVVALAALIERPITGHEIFEIGAEPMGYDELLMRSGEATRGKRNRIIRIPLFPVALAAWGVYLITGVSRQVAAALMGSLQNDSTVTNDRFHELVSRPYHPIDITLKKLAHEMQK